MAFELWPERGGRRSPTTSARSGGTTADGRRGALFVAEGDGALVGFVAGALALSNRFDEAIDLTLASLVRRVRRAA